MGREVLAGLSPHPPIIIPEVGRGEEKDAEATIRAMEELGTVFTSADHDTSLSSRRTALFSRRRPYARREAIVISGTSARAG